MDTERIGQKLDDYYWTSYVVLFLTLSAAHMFLSFTGRVASPTLLFVGLLVVVDAYILGYLAVRSLLLKVICWLVTIWNESESEPLAPSDDVSP